jgi:hypothetical protein
VSDVCVCLAISLIYGFKKKFRVDSIVLFPYRKKKRKSRIEITREEGKKSCGFFFFNEKKKKKFRSGPLISLTNTLRAEPLRFK